MISSKIIAISAFILSLETISADTVPFSPCPLLGPRFPIPRSINTSPIIQEGVKNLTDALNSYVASANGTYGDITPNTTSFSIALFSTEETNATEAFFYEYHHTAPSLRNVSEGVTKVDKNSVYRIGDLTTLFTAWLFLAEAGESFWEDPVSKHVPQLSRGRESNSSIYQAQWDKIILGDLAAHLGGIGRYSAPSERLNDPSLASLLGSIHTKGTAYQGTDEKGDISREQFLEEFARHASVFGVASTPIFSNAGYIILALALESIKGKSFADMLSDSIFAPLRMSSTTLLQPQSSSSGVFPTNTSAWTSALQIEAAYNGIYSSLSDVSRARKAIIGSDLLSQEVTNRWLKPVSHTSNLVNSVGRPWEIYSLTDTPISPVIPVYQVRGNVGLYSSHIGIVPDYKTGFVILAADTEVNPDLNAYADEIATQMIPALEKNAIVQATTALSGVYLASNTSNSSLSIAKAVDESPGLSLSAFMHNGVDVRAVYAKLNKVAPDDLSFRLFPTDLLEETEQGYKQAFRAVFQDIAAPADAGTPTCDTWRYVDELQVSGVPLDLFVFDVSSDEKVSSVEVPGLNLVLRKN